MYSNFIMICVKGRTLYSKIILGDFKLVSSPTRVDITDVDNNFKLSAPPSGEISPHISLSILSDTILHKP